MPRTTCKVFTSYADVDAGLCRKLLRLLQVQTAFSDKYEFLFWNDRLLLLEEEMLPEISKAVADCDFGLLLLSNAYVSSDFVLQNELPTFAGENAKPALAVEVKTLTELPDEANSLLELPVFRDGKRPFKICTGRQQKLFVERLHLQMETMLDALHA